VTPIAFVLVTIASHLKLSQMSELENHLNHGQKGLINLSKMESAILRCCKEIDLVLNPYLSLKLNKTGTGSIMPHSQNQIISLITAHLVNSHDLTTWEQKPSKVADDILKAAPAHYLLDIIKNTWKGSGDSRLFNTTWAEGDEAKPATHYAGSYSRQQLSDALTIWHEDSLDKKQVERANIPMSVKAVLLFIYAHIVTVFANKAVQFEIEHIYPVAYLMKQNKKHKDEGWPMSALGNLMLIPKDLNRIKKANLLGDFIPQQQNEGKISQEEIVKTQQYLLSPDWHTVKESSNPDLDSYKKFCRERLSVIENELAKSLKIN
jgi:hypothetical protein